MRFGGEAVEGTPVDIGAAVVQKVVSPVAMQIGAANGSTGVLHFYTAVITHLACDIAVIFDADTVDMIVQAAARAARERKLHVNSPGVH